MLVAGFGEIDGALLLVELVIFTRQLRDDLVDGGESPDRSSDGPEMMSGVRASSTRIELTSSTMAKAWPRWTICAMSYFILSRR